MNCRTNKRLLAVGRNGAAPGNFWCRARPTASRFLTESKPAPVDRVLIGAIHNAG